MRYPINVINIKKTFGSHKGIDFGWYKSVGENQPVYAIDDGIVIYNRYQASGGFVIHVRHDNGFVSEYGHLLKNSQLVREGTKVKKGQQIARMGSSGLNCFGAHLHLGLYKGTYINYKDKSKFVNPLPYLCMYDDQWVAEDRSKIPAKDLHHTKRVTAKDGLNVRTGPGTKYKLVVVAPYNSQLECFGVTKGWNIVDNTRGFYCSNKYLK